MIPRLPRTVAVIGAGPSGLVAAKELLHRGLDVLVLEQRQHIGGTWVYEQAATDAHGVESSAMYRSVTANASRPFLAYSDYPIPDEVPVYPRHADMARYFRSYADAFQVRRHVRCGCIVEAVAPAEEDRWVVVWRDTRGGERRREIFDAVVVANGHHSSPRWPEAIPGLETFPGPVLHSRAYKTPTVPVDTTDRRVLVVGIGNSGCDIATDLAGGAARVFLSTRSGGWVYPRWIEGRPVDQVDAECRLGRRLVPPWLAGLLEPAAMRRVRRRYFGRDGGVHRWGLQPAFGPYQSHAAVNDQFFCCIGNGSLSIRGALQGLDAGVAHFTDGSREAIDLVIFATGYTITFPFLSGDLLPVDGAANRVDLYRQILSPDLPATLGFVGLVQPQIGFMPIIEMQARWLAALWSGGVRLPPRGEMARVIERERRQRLDLYVDRPRHSLETEWPDYSDGLAAELGVLPRPLRHPRVLLPLLLAPIHAAHYRLDGEGACAALAEEILVSFACNLRSEIFNKR